MAIYGATLGTTIGTTVGAKIGAKSLGASPNPLPPGPASHHPHIPSTPYVTAPLDNVTHNTMSAKTSQAPRRAWLLGLMTLT